MGTRTWTAMKQADGTYKACYTHLDGYPASLGKIYNDNVKTNDDAIYVSTCGHRDSVMSENIKNRDIDTGDETGDFFEFENFEELTKDFLGNSHIEWLYVFEETNSSVPKMNVYNGRDFTPEEVEDIGMIDDGNDMWRFPDFKTAFKYDEGELEYLYQQNT